MKLIESNIMKYATSLARGAYQRDIVLGTRCLSGADLRGRAKEYIGKYRDSGNTVVARLVEHGIGYEAIGPHNRRDVIVEADSKALALANDPRRCAVLCEASRLLATPLYGPTLARLGATQDLSRLQIVSMLMGEQIIEADLATYRLVRTWISKGWITLDAPDDI